MKSYYEKYESYYFNKDASFDEKYKKWLFFIEGSPKNLAFVPVEFRTLEVCKIIVNNISDFSGAWKSIPLELRTSEFIEIVKYNRKREEKERRDHEEYQEWAKDQGIF